MGYDPGSWEGCGSYLHFVIQLQELLELSALSAFLKLRALKKCAPKMNELKVKTNCYNVKPFGCVCFKCTLFPSSHEIRITSDMQAIPITLQLNCNPYVARSMPG